MKTYRIIYDRADPPLQEVVGSFHAAKRRAGRAARDGVRAEVVDQTDGDVRLAYIARPSRQAHKRSPSAGLTTPPRSPG